MKETANFVIFLIEFGGSLICLAVFLAIFVGVFLFVRSFEVKACKSLEALVMALGGRMINSNKGEFFREGRAVSLTYSSYTRRNRGERLSLAVQGNFGSEWAIHTEDSIYTPVSISTLFHVTLICIRGLDKKCIFHGESEASVEALFKRDDFIKDFISGWRTFSCFQVNKDDCAFIRTPANIEALDSSSISSAAESLVRLSDIISSAPGFRSQ